MESIEEYVGVIARRVSLTKFNIEEGVCMCYRGRPKIILQEICHVWKSWHLSLSWKQINTQTWMSTYKIWLQKVVGFARSEYCARNEIHTNWGNRFHHVAEFFSKISKTVWRQTLIQTNSSNNRACFKVLYKLRDFLINNALLLLLFA